MKVIFSDNFMAPVRGASVVLTAGNATIPKSIDHAVTGIALFDTNITDCTIEASTDGFISTIYTNNLTNISQDIFIDIGASVIPADWRVLANANGTVGHLYVGTLILISNPSFPFDFEGNIVADDRLSQGGISFSRFQYQARQGQWSWDLVKGNSISNWKNWYQTTSGFRTQFVMTDPLNDASPFLVAAPGEFPLGLTFNDTYAGSMSIREVL